MTPKVIDILIPPTPESVTLSAANGGVLKIPLAKSKTESNILVEKYPVSRFPTQIIELLDKQCGVDHTQAVELYKFPKEAIVGDLILLPGDDEHPLRLVGMYGLKVMRVIQVMEGPFVKVAIKQSDIDKGYVVYYDSRDASVMVLLVEF